MNEKIKIENKFRKKISLLKEHNKNYFVDDNPKISDAEYDKIKKDLLDLEKKYPFLKKIDSVNKIFGAL